ncbi:MAG: AAA family ATPase [Chloroflexota bacterium]
MSAKHEEEKYMPSPLDQISIKGYKSIKELIDFPLKPLNILIGANGAGKTNFISFFNLLNQIVQNKLQVSIAQSGGANSYLYFGQKITPEIKIRLAFGRNSYQCTLVPAAGDTLIFSNELIWYHDQARYSKPLEVGLSGGQKETRLHEESHKRQAITIADYVIGAIRSWRVYHFHDTSASAKIKQQGDVNDNLMLRPDASNLAAYLYLLRETENDHYRKIVSTIQLVAPFFDDFSLRPNPLNLENIRLEWMEKGSDSYFNAQSLSDGTLRFMCLATLLLQPNLPSTIIIDEPELGLHPYAITVLASLLKSVSQKTQVVVSTQSVPLVNQFMPEDIVVVDRKEGQSTFERRTEKDLENWMDDYGMGDLWEKNLLGGRPR